MAQASPARNERAARQRHSFVTANQQQIDPARKQRAVSLHTRDEVGRQRTGAQCGCTANAGTTEDQLQSFGQRINLDHQCCRTIRIFGRPEREAIEIRHSRAAMHQSEGRLGRTACQRRAGLKPQPCRDLRFEREAIVEPNRRVMIEQGQRDRSTRRHQRRRRFRSICYHLNRTRTGQRVHHTAKDRLRRLNRTGKSRTGLEVGMKRHDQFSPLTSV